MAPDTLAVLYRHIPQRDVLIANCISKNHVDSLAGLEIPIADEISGWVGANRQSIVNADRRLDFGDQVAETDCLRSCLSVPIANDSGLLGVLSLSSSSPDAFNPEQLNMIENMAQLVSSRSCRPLTSLWSAWTRLRLIEARKSSRRGT